MHAHDVEQKRGVEGPSEGEVLLVEVRHGDVTLRLPKGFYRELRVKYVSGF